MPDGGNSGGNTYSTSQSTSQTGPSPVIAPRLESIGNDFWNWYGDNANAPAYYPGSTIAAPSPFSLNTRGQAWDYANAGMQGLDASLAPALNYFTDTASGKYVDPKSNQAFQDFLTASFRPQAEQFRDIIAPSIDSKFIGSGRVAYGGQGAHSDATVRGIQELEQAQSDAAAKAGLGLYQGERNLQASAASAIPALASARAGLAGNYLGLMDRIGAADTGYQQSLIDDSVARYNYGQTAQPDWYARMAQILQSIYPGGQTSSSGTSSGYGGRSGGSGWLGGAMGLAGLGLQAASLFSDERLKEDIRPVGELHDGQTVYSYRYKGEPATHIGLMAQEVEKVHPEAVSEHPSGFKMVDYSKAVPSGGLF